MIVATSENYLIIVMDALDGTIIGKYGFLPNNSLSKNVFTPPFGIQVANDNTMIVIIN